MAKNTKDDKTPQNNDIAVEVASATASFGKVAEPFVCGGTAASFASCVIHPIDLAKVCVCLCVCWCESVRMPIVGRRYPARTRTFGRKFKFN